MSQIIKLAKQMLWHNMAVQDYSTAHIQMVNLYSIPNMKNTLNKICSTLLYLASTCQNIKMMPKTNHMAIHFLDLKTKLSNINGLFAGEEGGTCNSLNPAVAMWLEMQGKHTTKVGAGEIPKKKI